MTDLQKYAKELKDKLDYELWQLGYNEPTEIKPVWTTEDTIVVISLVIIIVCQILLILGVMR